MKTNAIFTIIFSMIVMSFSISSNQKKALIFQTCVNFKTVISFDFYPTILEMLGLKVPAEQKPDGVSITSFVEGKNELDRDAIFWHFLHYSNHGVPSPGGDIRSGDYNLLEYFENNTVQLFNLKDDLSEQNDLSKIEVEIAQEQEDKLHQ